MSIFGSYQARASAFPIQEVTIELIHSQYESEKLTLSVPADEEVFHIKQRIQGVFDTRDRLVLRGKVLLEHLSLADQGYKPGDALFLVPSYRHIRHSFPRGGSGPAVTTDKPSLIRRVNQMPVSHFFAALGIGDFPGRLPDSARASSFLRQVYAVVTLQFILAASFAGGMLHFGWQCSWLAQNLGWAVVTAVIGTAVAMGTVARFKNVYPGNYVLLVACTLFQCGLAGLVCSVLVRYPGATDVAVFALCAVVAVFAMLSLLTACAGASSGVLCGTIVAFCVVALVWIMARLVMDIPRGSAWAALAVALLCSFFVYDAEEIADKYGPDDWVIAVLELYLDCFSLFVFLAAALVSYCACCALRWPNQLLLLRLAALA